MKFSDEIVRAATLYLHQKTFGSNRLLLALPKAERDKCLKCMAIIQQSKGSADHGETKLEPDQSA
jgi:hypothetical protein